MLASLAADVLGGVLALGLVALAVYRLTAALERHRLTRWPASPLARALETIHVERELEADRG